MVELALLLPVLLLILLAIIDFSRVFYAYIGITNAAREGARYGASYPGDTGAIVAETIAEVDGTAIVLDTTDVSVSFPQGNAPGRPVTVNVQYSFSLITPLMGTILGGNSLVIQTSATMAIATLQ